VEPKPFDEDLSRDQLIKARHDAKAATIKRLEKQVEELFCQAEREEPHRASRSTVLGKAPRSSERKRKRRKRAGGRKSRPIRGEKDASPRLKKSSEPNEPRPFTRRLQARRLHPLAHSRCLETRKRLRDSGRLRNLPLAEINLAESKEC